MQNNQGNVMSSKVEEARRNFTSHKEKYEKLRADVAIKMRFLDENKVSIVFYYVKRRITPFAICPTYCLNFFILTNI